MNRRLIKIKYDKNEESGKEWFKFKCLLIILGIEKITLKDKYEKFKTFNYIFTKNITFYSILKFCSIRKG